MSDELNFLSDSLSFYPAILQKYLDNFDLSIKVIYIVGTLGFSIGLLIHENKRMPVIQHGQILIVSIDMKVERSIKGVIPPYLRNRSHGNLP